MRLRSLLLSCATLGLLTSVAVAQTKAADPDAQARAMVGQLSVEEKVGLVHGVMVLPIGRKTEIPPGAVPGAGFIGGVPRLGLPDIKETDASLGVSYVSGARHDGATALPSGLATASTWNPDIAYAGGAMVGREAWLTGFNVLLGGGLDLARDPRNGRNFEYLGEDPLLAGVLAGEAIRGTQDQHVVSTIKHYALNDQETGRNYLSANIGEAAARESDLLAFQIAIERGHPGSVMCAYNRYNGVYACENDFLLNQVLKHDWSYPGWVMSDWGAVHSLKAALNGLDQESGSQIDKEVYFDKPLLAAAKSDPAYAARLDDMAHRIVRSLYAVGAVDHPPQKGALDLAAGGEVARQVEDQAIVLLRNQDGLLPLTAGAKRIAVIGGHADLGVVSGGGSTQVAPPGGPALDEPLGGEGPLSFMRHIFYMPSSPLKAIKAAAPQASVRYDDGRYPSAAALLAKQSDVAIVFVTQWMTEAYDAPDLSLPQGQDALIAAVAAANPHTIVVLETGGPVLMPWLDKVGAVLEAWYPGARGGEAIADILVGKTSPSGRLPITFPASLDQTPRPILPGQGLAADALFDVDYPEGSDVGYRWFAKTGQAPLFAFGHGLTYTRFTYQDLILQPGASPTATWTITNAGDREGTDVSQLYLTQTPRRAQQRLLGWSRQTLKPGESRRVTVKVDPRLLADWDQTAHRWRTDAGVYRISAGASAANLTLASEIKLRGASFADKAR